MDATKNTAQKAWAAVVRRAKEHHESVNAAVDVYYGNASMVSPAPSPASTAPTSPESASARSSIDKMWDGVKKHAKEHHQSVNTAYTTYYGRA